MEDSIVQMATNLGMAGVLAYIVYYQIKNTKELQDKYLEIQSKNAQVLEALIIRIEAIDKRIDTEEMRRCPMIHSKPLAFNKN